MRDRYLALIAVFSVLFTLARTNGEYVLATLVKRSAIEASTAGGIRPDQIGEYIGATYARYGLWVNIAGLVLQAFLVSRIIRRFGFAVAFLMLPVVAVVGSAALRAFPTLAVSLSTRVSENAVDYSLLNTARNLLWQPTPRHAKYIAKQVVDTFFIRAGDVVSALFVFVGSALGGLSVRAFVGVNLCAVIMTLVVGRAVLVERSRLLALRRARGYQAVARALRARHVAPGLAR